MVEVHADQNGVRLIWDVANVSSASIVAAGCFLFQQNDPVDITLEFYWGAWNRERHTSPDRATKRIAALAGYRDVEPYRGTKVVKRSMDTVRDEGALIRAAFEAWDAGKSTFLRRLDERFGNIAEFALAFRRNRRDSHLVFDHIGRASGAVRVFGRDWADTARGRYCDRSQPDFEFDERVCDDYQTVLEKGEPIVDHIRAVIHRDQGDPVWVPYRRLVLPTRDRMGTPMIVSVCDIRQDVAIPFMPA